MTISLGQVEGSPIHPTPKTCRAVLAQVFNRDNWQDDVTPAEAVVILASKLLADSGHDGDHIVSIFRYFREDIEYWAKHVSGSLRMANNLLVLTIMDNRRASLIGPLHDRRCQGERRVFEFKEGVEATASPVPILQLSVTLSGLLALIVEPAGPSSSHRAGVAAPVVASPDHPIVP